MPQFEASADAAPHKRTETSPVTFSGLVETCLRCDGCGGTLRIAGDADSPTQLCCEHCDRRVPVERGIPRFVTVPADELSRRTQESFGYEWSHFSDWTPSGEVNFQDYFHGLDLATLRNATVLDAGCGMGRHARQLAPHVGALIAIDFSRAIDAAARNTDGTGNVHCVQADLTRLPLADEAFDFVYSMGVVHHLSNTGQVVGDLARKLRAGGRLRLYLYWKRQGWIGRLLRVVDVARVVSTRLPLPLLRVLCLALSAVLWPAVVLPYRVLSALGMRGHQSWPLFVYTKYPFTVLYNDQFDRFSAPLEKRYTAEEAAALLRSAGLRDIEVRPMFGWLVDGIR